MDNVGCLLASASAALVAPQVVILAARLRSCVRRGEPVRLAALLLLLPLILLSTPGSPARDVALIPALWAGGSFLSRTQGSRARVWTASCWALLLILLMASALGYGTTAPFAAFHAFSLGALAAVGIARLARLCLSSRSLTALATLLPCVGWLAAGAVRAAVGPAGAAALLEDISVLLLAGGTAWLVYQEGYPLRAGWNGELPALHGQETLARSSYARLLSAEGALAARERLVASGVLALGAAHEMKNTLSHITATARHGLQSVDPGTKDECLTLLLEHASIGRDSAVGLLERIAREGREEPRLLDASVDFAEFLRMARAAFRGEGVVVSVDMGSGVRFNARRREVEQILMNLLRNAVESYRRTAPSRTMTVRVSAELRGDCAVLEVADEAGGVPPDVAAGMFSAPIAAADGAGLGLYLSRSLAEANAGSLDYQPVDGGSVFRLAFLVE